MGKKGGFMGGGMPGNMSNLMKQAQRMQRQMEQQQAEAEAKLADLANQQFTASAGGGAVTVTFTGDGKLSGVKISPDALDPDDAETLEEMITVAVNDGLAKVQAAVDEIEKSAGSGMSGLSGFGF